MQVIGVVTRYQSTPKKSHSSTAKMIFKYLRSTMDYGLWYTKGQNISLIAYIVVDWVGSVNDRKITSGGALFLGNIIVTRVNKKQTYISLSTIEVEYIALVASCT